jgi:hypothetical protein
MDTFRIEDKDGKSVSRVLYGTWRVREWFTNFRPWRPDLKVEDFIVKNNKTNEIVRILDGRT